jgi:hypothetical protein
MKLARSILGLVSLGATFVGLCAAPASAQTTIQGQIMIQEAGPTTTVAPPPAPQASAYVVSAPPPSSACPEGSQLMPNRHGQMTCMAEMERHHVIGGLLGGGIGLLAGGWLVEIISTLVTTIGGAVSCAASFGCSWATSGNFSTYSWSGYVPLIGPWIQMGTLWNNADGGMYAWLAVEGLLQAGGLTMLIFGALGEDVMEWQPIAGLDLQLAPALSATSQGLAVTGRF